MKTIKFILRYLGITWSAILYAVGISLFLNPNNLAPGGVSGIAIIIHSVLPVPIGVGGLIVLINIPIMIAGAWKFGIRFILSTIYTLVISSIAIDTIPKLAKIGALTNNFMLAAVIGGALMGVSMGIMFRLNTTTGGSDIIVKIIRQYKPYLRSGQIFLVIDAIVVATSAVVFKNLELALFAVVAIYITSVFLNRTLYIGDEATLVYIVSKKREIIAHRMLDELNIGATMIHAVGAYSNEETEVILCVMRKQNLSKVRKIVKETDFSAFMIVSTANEVFGEGFKNQYKAEL